MINNARVDRFLLDPSFFLNGVSNILNLRGDLRRLRFLELNDTTNVYSDWQKIGEDISVSIGLFESDLHRNKLNVR